MFLEIFFVLVILLKPIHFNATEFKNWKIDDLGVLLDDISLLNANDHL